MKTLYASALTALFAATLAHGDIIAVSNLGETTDNKTAVNENLLIATSFTTGDLGGGYELSSIGFQYGLSGAGPDELEVFLYSSLNGKPENPITGKFATAGVEGDIKSVNLSHDLDANTMYFVLLKASAGNSVYAAVTSSTDQTPGDIPSVGAGWGIGDSQWFKAGATPWEDYGSEPLKISVNVVPEPSVHLLILTGGGFVFVGHRWRTRAKGKQEESS